MSARSRIRPDARCSSGFESASARGTRLNIHMTFADEAAMRTAVELYGGVSGGMETMERIAGYLER